MNTNKLCRSIFLCHDIFTYNIDIQAKKYTPESFSSALIESCYGWDGIKEGQTTIIWPNTLIKSNS